jgi:hypothetical protein
MDVHVGMQEPELVYVRKDDLEKLRAALRDIKFIVCGDRVPYWTGDNAVTRSRGMIADICDTAL